MPKANEVGNVKTEMVGLSWKRKEKLRERQLISSRQRAVGVLLIVLGVLVFAVGLFGYLAGDLQLSSLSWLSDQVYVAREAAQSAGTTVTGAFDLYGEDSGVRVFYATYAAGEESGAISAQDFELGEDKGSLKGEGLQFPGTKDYKNLVIAEETPVTLDNGMEFTQSVKLRGAGSSKYRSLKLTVEGPGTLTVYALSSLADQERQLVLYNTRNGAEVSTAMAPASAEGALTPLTFEIPEAGTFYLSSKGDVPIAPMSTLMNIAIILLLVGMVLYSQSLFFVGILLFSLTTIFQLITLPVEFNASHRALQTLENEQLLYDDELPGARKVLKAAALTYVAALLMSALQLLRYVLIFVGRNNRGRRDN